MTNSPASQFDLQQVHCALRISTPLDQVSPMVLYTLTVIAHCWRGRVPANLWPQAVAAAEVQRQTQITWLAPCPDGAQQSIDFKRRASGDFE